MMERLVKRGEGLARAAQQRAIGSVAAQLKAMLGGALIEVEEARVIVRGRGIVKRWLIDPGLRFLTGGPK